MSEPTISFKRHNHRVLTCESARKQELLKHLTEQHSEQKVLVISAANTTTTEVEGKHITLSNDAGLAKMSTRKWDILISFDLPSDPADYVKRLSHAREMALIIADEKKDKGFIYPIEALIGRTITREIISGFEEKVDVVRRETPEQKPKHRPTSSQKREEEKNPYVHKKPSQRNHKYDGTIRSESEKRQDGKKTFEKKVWDKKDAEKKPYEKKEWDKGSNDKKPFEKKPWDQDKGDKKPYERKSSSSNDYRNKDTAAQKPSRKPRVIKVPSKPKESK